MDRISGEKYTPAAISVGYQEMRAPGVRHDDPVLEMSTRKLTQEIAGICDYRHFVREAR
jgi:hypothetical protein